MGTNCIMVDKRKEHELLSRLVAEFQSKGGVIQQIPEGQRGKCLPIKDPVKPIPPKLPTGARCIICDWSPTDSRSVCNPEIAEYGGNKLEIDELTGDMLCRVCLSHAARMNRDFKIEADPNYGQSKYLLNDEAKEFFSSESYLEERVGRLSTVHEGRIVPGAYRISGTHAE